MHMFCILLFWNKALKLHKKCGEEQTYMYSEINTGSIIMNTSCRIKDFYKAKIMVQTTNPFFKRGLLAWMHWLHIQ